MNSVTRMFLVSEDQYRRNMNRPTVTKKVLNKKLPIETQVRLLNSLRAKKNDEFLAPKSGPDLFNLDKDP